MSESNCVNGVSCFIGNYAHFRWARESTLSIKKIPLLFTFIFSLFLSSL